MFSTQFFCIVLRLRCKIIHIDITRTKSITISFISFNDIKLFMETPQVLFLIQGYKIQSIILCNYVHMYIPYKQKVITSNYSEINQTSEFIITTYHLLIQQCYSFYIVTKKLSVFNNFYFKKLRIGRGVQSAKNISTNQPEEHFRRIFFYLIKQILCNIYQTGAQGQWFLAQTGGVM